MNIYLISQTENENYDTYDSMVVFAENEEEARNTPPEDHSFDEEYSSGTWCNSPEFVKVVLLGTAVKGSKAGIVCASFKAG